MKPTLVDNCEHYNRTTHACDKCGRGLPDVCFEFEEMKKKASSYDTMQNQDSLRNQPETTGSSSPEVISSVRVDSGETQQAKKTRGRRRKVNVETNDTN